MKKIIVTTTIQSPTKATKLFSEKENWELLVVGDLKTPHEEYKKINCTYLHPEYQDKKYEKISNLLGWNTIQRRNIGFIEAFNLGADIIATVDDDNIPYDSWGNNLLLKKQIEVDLYEPVKSDYFDPLSVTNRNDLWHRGYPIEHLQIKNNVEYKGKIKKQFYVQADLWDGDPDIDAICRLANRPCVKFDDIKPFTSNKLSPFNSQNTFLDRDIIPYYMVLPHVGRMDDIWGGYLLEKKFGSCVVYNKATVYQERNPQDLIKNLENEIIGYKNTLNLLENKYKLDQKILEIYDTYKSYFNIG
jgi:hypothetical protein